tara:strand:- start:287 stop:1456 length:1170 start_codon:yes stop_codon:yes gene_type:complete
LYFQTLDDKRQCIGIYKEGKIFFDSMPEDLRRTWSFTGSIKDKKVEYAQIYANGKSLEEACPEEFKEELKQSNKRFGACIKSFGTAKIDPREHCLFDMVPYRFLMQFCEIRDKITRHVFENEQKPRNYALLSESYKLLHKIKYQELNVNTEGCRNLQLSTKDRKKVSQLLQHRYVDYNLFGAATGRLTTHPKSFPILSVRKDFRSLLKPNNDWFLQLDYNSADVRTFINLIGEPQPEGDVHEWNVKNLFNGNCTREEAKVKFFAWLFNPDSNAVENKRYNRDNILDKWYKNGYISNPYKRKIKVEERKALSYLVQSTTNDRILDRAIEIDALLEGRKSYIAFFIHDEVAIDFAQEDKDLLPKIKEIFEHGGFKSNISVGRDYYNLRNLK